MKMQRGVVFETLFTLLHDKSMCVGAFSHLICRGKIFRILIF